MKVILTYAGEVTIKGKDTRSKMQNRLIFNLKDLLNRYNAKLLKFEKLGGYVILEVNGKEEIMDVLPKLFGISKAYLVKEGTQYSLSELKEKIKEVYCNQVNGKKFGVRIRKYNSDVSKTELEKYIGKVLKDECSGVVNLENPDVWIKMIVIDNNIYMVEREYEGEGGLPLGSGDKGLSLISGGIDSSLASLLIMKRGNPLDFVHYNLGGNREFVKDITYFLYFNYSFGYEPVLYIVNFVPLLAKILTTFKKHESVVALKRSMLIASEMLAKEARFLVTGDSLNQVSSQTATNILIEEMGISLPIFRPLIAFDKKDIYLFGIKYKLPQVNVKVPEYCGISSSASPRVNVNVIEKVESLRDDIEKSVKDAEEIKVKEIRTHTAHH